MEHIIKLEPLEDDHDPLHMDTKEYSSMQMPSEINLKAIELQLKRFCRLCLRKQCKMLPLRSRLREVLITEMIAHVATIGDLESTVLPQQVCNKCLAKLDIAYQVRTEFDSNALLLMEFFNSGQLVESLLEHQRGEISPPANESEKLIEESRVMLTESLDLANETKMLLNVEAITEKAPDEKHGMVKQEVESYSETDESELTEDYGESPEQICEPTLKTARTETRIVEEPISLDPNKCYICDEDNAGPLELETHLAVHVDMLPFCCSDCAVPGGQKEIISSLAMLLRHFRSHNFSHKCSYCPKRFKLHRGLTGHVRNTHEFKNPDGFTCSECGMKTMSKKKYWAHMRGHQYVKLGRFRCEICDKRFTTKARLERHARLHTGQKPFSCLYCSETFVDETRLQKHRQRHINEKGYKCEDCGEMFYDKNVLNYHMLKHNPEKREKTAAKTYTPQLKDPVCPFPGCNYVAPTYAAFYTHKGNHEMAHQCSECGEKFAQKWKLRRHDSMKHKNSHPIKCEECGKLFQTWARLRDHANIHADIRNYVCDICGMRFVKPSTLQGHKKVHSDARPYPCEICGNTFKYRSDLNKHRKLKHGSFPNTGAIAIPQETIQKAEQNKVLEEMNNSESIAEAELDVSQEPAGLILDCEVKLEGIIQNE